MLEQSNIEKSVNALRSTIENEIQQTDLEPKNKADTIMFLYQLCDFIVDTANTAMKPKKVPHPLTINVECTNTTCTWDADKCPKCGWSIRIM